MVAFTADRRLFLTRDRKRVVEEGDKDAGFLLAAAGREISESDAEAYGLECRDGKVVLPQPTPSKPPEDPKKSIEKSEDKSRKREGDKSAGKK